MIYMDNVVFLDVEDWPYLLWVLWRHTWGCWIRWKQGLWGWFIQKGVRCCPWRLGIDERFWIDDVECKPFGHPYCFLFTFLYSFCIILSSTILYCNNFALMRYILEVKSGFILVIMFFIICKFCLLLLQDSHLLFF